MGEAGGSAEAGHDEDGHHLDATRPPRLLVWTFAGFHAAFLVALAVAAVYLAGVANEGLAALETWIGVLAYLYLWGVTWWTNRRMLEAVGPGFVAGRASRTAVFVEASKWGGVTGFLVFLPALVVVVVRFVAAGGLQAVPFVVLATGVGSVLSVGVGGFVGAGLALLDLLLLRLARAWLPVTVADSLESAVPDS